MEAIGRHAKRDVVVNRELGSQQGLDRETRAMQNNLWQSFREGPADDWDG